MQNNADALVNALQKWGSAYLWVPKAPHAPYYPRTIPSPHVDLHICSSGSYHKRDSLIAKFGVWIVPWSEQTARRTFFFSSTLSWNRNTSRRHGRPYTSVDPVGKYHGTMVSYASNMNSSDINNLSRQYLENIVRNPGPFVSEEIVDMMDGMNPMDALSSMKILLVSKWALHMKTQETCWLLDRVMLVSTAQSSVAHILILPVVLED